MLGSQIFVRRMSLFKLVFLVYRVVVRNTLLKQNSFMFGFNNLMVNGSMFWEFDFFIVSEGGKKYQMCMEPTIISGKAVNLILIKHKIWNCL